MSQENVEIVKRANELLERRDWHGMSDILDLRDARIVRMQGYMNPAEALAAVGLREHGAPADS
jgi:hypothetical protein